MKPLEPPDLYHLRAAVGWLELGQHVDANEELENITPQLRAHPDVLKVRWRVYAKAGRWDGCLEIGRALTELEPNKPGEWIDYARSLHRLNRTGEAYDLLASAVGLSRSKQQCFITLRFMPVPYAGYLKPGRDWSVPLRLATLFRSS